MNPSCGSSGGGPVWGRAVVAAGIKESSTGGTKVVK